MGKKKLVISTGAGMSAESGINTFRDAAGYGRTTM
jgi:NAD-dependent SIR2 family protein deacetylase